MTVVQAVEGSGSWVRIAFSGEIDIETTDVIRQAVDAALAEHPDATLVELDLAAVTLIDSTGVGTLVSVHRGLSERGIRLLVTNPVKIVERVFKVTGVFQMLTGSGVSTQRRRGSSR